MESRLSRHNHLVLPLQISSLLWDVTKSLAGNGAQTAEHGSGHGGAPGMGHAPRWAEAERVRPEDQRVSACGCAVSPNAPIPTVSRA